MTPFTPLSQTLYRGLNILPPTLVCPPGMSVNEVPRLPAIEGEVGRGNSQTLLLEDLASLDLGQVSQH